MYFLLFTFSLLCSNYLHYIVSDLLLLPLFVLHILFILFLFLFLLLDWLLVFLLVPLLLFLFLFSQSCSSCNSSFCWYILVSSSALFVAFVGTCQVAIDHFHNNLVPSLFLFLNLLVPFQLQKINLFLFYCLPHSFSLSLSLYIYIYISWIFLNTPPTSSIFSLTCYFSNLIISFFIFLSNSSRQIFSLSLYFHLWTWFTHSLIFRFDYLCSI